MLKKLHLLVFTYYKWNRIYSSINDLPGYFNNMGIHILSTSHGVMSDRQAKKVNVGGEVICKVF